MRADAEHEQHHTDLGELRGEMRVGDPARRVRTHRDAGEEVTDERRQAQPYRRKPEHKGEREANGERGDQGVFVQHGAGMRREAS